MRKAVNHLKKSDPVLCAIIERVGPCRMEFGEPEFASVAESIVYQQLNGKAAATIFERFAALAGDPLTPEGILNLSDAQLRGVGLSKQKSAYLKDLAAKTAAGVLDFARLPGVVGRRSDRASDTGEGHRGVDGAYVSDVFTAASKCAAHGRLWRAGGHQETLQEAQAAETERYGEDCAGLGALSQRGLLVYVEEFGHQDRLVFSRRLASVNLCALCG